MYAIRAKVISLGKEYENRGAYTNIFLLNQEIFFKKTETSASVVTTTRLLHWDEVYPLIVFIF